MSKTTLDLSTLSDITGGTHTVKVKAKANGYNDSEFSNEVSYTKVVSKTLTFTGALTDFLGGSETYAKVGSAPTSNNDYQYEYSQSGTYDFTGSVDVYVWGSDGANSGAYAIDSTSQDSMKKVNGWSSPTKLTFTESKILCLFKAGMM